MKKKLNYIHNCFLSNSLAKQRNDFIFNEYCSDNLSIKKINQLYCYVKYCSIYKKNLFFYQKRVGERYGITKPEFENLIKITNLLNNFNFEKYSYYSIIILILRYVIGYIHG